MRRVFREEMEKRDAVISELQEELESVKETLMRIEQKGEESAKTALDRDREVMEAIRTVQTVTQQQSSRTWWQRIRGK
jgi:predicted transposase YdaD